MDKNKITRLDDFRGGDDAPAGKVRCAKCGEEVDMRTTKCPYCGINFLGVAFEFTHGSERMDSAGTCMTAKDRVLRVFLVLMAVGLSILMLVALLSAW